MKFWIQYLLYCHNRNTLGHFNRLVIDLLTKLRHMTYCQIKIYSVLWWKSHETNWAFGYSKKEETLSYFFIYIIHQKRYVCDAQPVDIYREFSPFYSKYYNNGFWIEVLFSIKLCNSGYETEVLLVLGNAFQLSLIHISTGLVWISNNYK